MRFVVVLTSCSRSRGLKQSHQGCDQARLPERSRNSIAHPGFRQASTIQACGVCIDPKMARRLPTACAPTGSLSPKAGGCPPALPWGTAGLHVPSDLRTLVRSSANTIPPWRRSGACGHDCLVAFSCKGRGVCPACNTRRMAEPSAHLCDDAFPRLPVRQCGLSVPKKDDCAGAGLRPQPGFSCPLCACRFFGH